MLCRHFSHYPLGSGYQILHPRPPSLLLPSPPPIIQPAVEIVHVGWELYLHPPHFILYQALHFFQDRGHKHQEQDWGEQGALGLLLAAAPLPLIFPSHATSNSLGDINLSNQGTQHRRGSQPANLASTSALRTFWKPPLTTQNAPPTDPSFSRQCLALTTDLYKTSTAERPRTELYCWW